MAKSNFDGIVMAQVSLQDIDGNTITSFSRQSSNPSHALADIILDVNTAYEAQPSNWANMTVILTNLQPDPNISG